MLFLSSRNPRLNPYQLRNYVLLVGITVLSITTLIVGWIPAARSSTVAQSFIYDTTPTFINSEVSNTNNPTIPLQCLELQHSDDVHNRTRPVPEDTDLCLLYSKPSLYIHTMMQLLVGTPNQLRCNITTGCQPPLLPYDEELRMYGNDWPPFGYTMIGKARLENLRAALEEVDRKQIPGAVVEMGVWRGGAMMLAAAVQKQRRNARDIYLYDAFDFIPGYGNALGTFLKNSLEDVKSNFQLFDLDGPNIKFVRGLFQDSVTKWPRGTPIAVLRIDANFYDSYQDALYSMYEDVPIGGIVIFDDIMSYPDVMQCWKDFKEDQPKVVETLNRIDTHSAWFRKRVAVHLDHSKKRSPQDVNKNIE